MKTNDEGTNDVEHEEKKKTKAKKKFVRETIEANQSYSNLCANEGRGWTWRGGIRR
jgi:hypothetical protein